MRKNSFSNFKSLRRRTRSRRVIVAEPSPLMDADYERGSIRRIKLVNFMSRCFDGAVNRLNF